MAGLPHPLPEAPGRRKRRPTKPASTAHRRGRTFDAPRSDPRKSGLISSRLRWLGAALSSGRPTIRASRLCSCSRSARESCPVRQRNGAAAGVDAVRSTLTAGQLGAARAKTNGTPVQQAMPASQAGCAPPRGSLRPKPSDRTVAAAHSGTPMAAGSRTDTPDPVGVALASSTTMTTSRTPSPAEPTVTGQSRIRCDRSRCSFDHREGT